MINLVNRTIEIKPGVVEKIIGFQVWWATPFGLVADLDEAITRCVANDIDPNTCIQAMPAAVTDSTYEIAR
jgi:hypothetical protein